VWGLTSPSPNLHMPCSMAPIAVQREVLSRMLAHARAEAPRECCGLLAGRDAEISAVWPCANVLASTSAFEIAPPELIGISKAIRSRGLQLTGIYHSHARGENYPSPADIERAYYPEACYFIISPAASVGRPIRAFRIVDQRVSELEILLR
jgi:[CysO sulfur-carrier protein]-S-L-cysteine hydrolase